MTLETKLQQKLDENWQRFQSEEYFQDLKKFDEWLNEKNFYNLRDEGKLIPNTILHPAHWNTSQIVCEGLIEIISNHGYTPTAALPGKLNAIESQEKEANGIAHRTFKIELIGQSPPAYGEITFQHRHDTFYFLEPPQIKITTQNTNQTKIVICTSMKFVDEANEFKPKYESDTITITSPQREKIDTHWDTLKEMELVEEKTRITNNHFQKIKEANKVLIWNQTKQGTPGNIGPNTIMEMAVAYAAGKSIYLLEDPQDEATRLEALGMKPNVLYGDIEKIFSNTS